MTESCDLQTTPAQHEEEQEILLRLGDILPRVPAHLLKPGPHDGAAQVRFSVDELAEKISHGRVSVPLDRLASACPTVFRGSEAFPGEQEIQLPLQKLLTQVGLLIFPKPPAPNGMPREQLAQARAEASRIIEAATPPPARPSVAEAPADLPAAAVAEPVPPPAKPAKSFARQLFGLFGRSSEPAPKEKSTDEKPAPPVEAKDPETRPTGEAIPPGCIALRLLPIFRLMPPEVAKSGAQPPEDARIALPLSAIDEQLIDGHVEIPIEDFIKALPANLKGFVNPVPDARVWIPLDEIFQNLPPDHVFYMPPLEPEPVPAEEAPKAEPEVETKDLKEKAPVETKDLKEKTPSAAPEPAKPVEPAVESPVPEPVAPTHTSSETAPPSPAPEEAKPEAVSKPVPAPSTPEPGPPSAPVAPGPAPAPEAATHAPKPAIEPPASAAPEASRAPWMRGFQVPPPRLFSEGAVLAEATAEPPPEPSPVAAPTPEAKRTVDFLASQTGVFAAAAFVQGAVFASADFPRKPDLGALRDFMGSFVDHARESGQRLGWNRVLTIACEQFHVTAVVRESHFIVALHHDRILPSLAHDALITAAEDLSKAAV